ncbi:hypothetical protein BH18THE2_BH18THE2_39040 [soil metagenome]
MLFLEKIYCPEEQRERANKALKLNGDISPDYDPGLLAICQLNFNT